jgi:hypothetical protein
MDITIKNGNRNRTIDLSDRIRKQRPKVDTHILALKTLSRYHRVMSRTDKIIALTIRSIARVFTMQAYNIETAIEKYCQNRKYVTKFHL